jgi:Transglycosylase SLT domain
MPRREMAYSPAHPPKRRPSRRRGLIRLALLVATIALVVGVIVALTDNGPPPLPLPGIGRPARPGDPFAYIPGRQADFVTRATAGNVHVLFVKSPGGALATAARVAALRGLIDAASAGTGIDPDTLEGIVFLESAGDPNAIAGADPSAAAGLTQIVAQTGQSLLGMHINLARSRQLTAAIDRAYALGQPSAIAHLQRERAAIDDRFDPRKALAATVRYLELARAHFGRSDLAVVSYHMGIGNLENVLSAYDGGHRVPYVQLFFDAAPDNHRAAYQLLSGFGDDSWTYYWRVRAAEQIMRLYRTDPATLRRLATLQTDAGSAALVLHPPGAGSSFADPDSLDAAYAQHVILPLPANPSALGLAYDPSMGSLAPRLGFTNALYRGLRGPALDLLIELAGRVRSLWHGTRPLIVTSTVEDRRYQQLEGINDPPTAAGWSFTIARRYASEAQALAFQAMLDRLQALNLIAWQRNPSEIEVTVASDAGRAIVDGP